MIPKEKTGFTSDERLLIYVTYSFEDFQDIWGGDLEQYKDFLLARQREFQQWQEDYFGSWIVLVPFDKSDFSSWLRRNPTRNLCRDKHASWALWVARNPKHLEYIRGLHPLQHYILKDESLKALLFAWFLPTVIPDASKIHSLRQALPQDFLYRLRKQFISKTLHPLPDFQRFSPSRGSGATILLGDHLVDPETIDKISDHVEESTIGSWENSSSCTINIADTDRIYLNPHWSYPRLFILSLPLLVLGSAFDCETVTVKISRAECGELPLKIWRSYLQDFELDLYPGKGADFAIAGFTKHIHNQIKREMPIYHELNLTQRPSYIRRIK